MSDTLQSVAADSGFTGHNVLVTGGAGFVGSHLVDALVQTNTVTVLDDLSTGKLGNLHPKVRFIEGDIRNREQVEAAMDGVDTVFHQTGLVSVEESVENPRKSQTINVGGTMEILDCARRHDARVITASSAAVYGEPSAVPVPETARLEPTSPYGTDKLAADHYTRLFADIYGLPTVALRYFNVYGPRQSASDYSGVISTFLEQAQRHGRLTVHGDGTQTRDFVHVDDIVRANLLAATTDHTGEAFNVGTGTEQSVNELAASVAELVTADPEIVHTDERPGDIERSCADTEKIEELLGFDAQVELRDGLETLLPDGIRAGN